MKKFLSLLLVTGVVMNPLYAQQLEVIVNNIDSNKPGQIIAMLFEKDGFPKVHSKAIETFKIAKLAPQVSFTFTQYPEEFAIKILHDEDYSGEVSKNWTGIIPAEGLGFSNGAKLNFGPPTFKQAKLVRKQLNKLQVNTPIAIQMIYP